MKTIEINMEEFETLEEIHLYIGKNLEFSSFYGSNLDALYDELTSLCEPVAVRLHLSRNEQSPIYLSGKKIMCVFQNAEKENENLHLISGW